MTRAPAVAAVAAGLLLGSMPWWRYAVHGVAGAPHANHEPRHGGDLGMAGEHHVELVRRAEGLEVHVSDAWRRPVRPRDVQVVLDGAARMSLRWDGRRSVGPDAGGAREIETVVTLDDGARLAVTFAASDPPDDPGRPAR